MPDDKLVSCIIIFFNAQKFLKEAIDSVLNQTYRNWELILVDDGSSDQSTEIALEYSTKYPEKIFYYEHPDHRNYGMSASRNLGIRNSRGEFLSFLDADDIWLPGKLERQVNIMDSYPEAGMVYGRALIWYSWNTDEYVKEKDNFIELGVSPNNIFQPPELFFLLIRNKAQTPMTSNAMVRRITVELIGGFEDNFISMYEDQVFFSKINLHFPVFVSDECWIKYRQHDASCTNKALKEGYWKQRRPFIKWLFTYVSEKTVKNEEIVQAVKKELKLCSFPFLFKRYYHLKDKIN